MQQERSDTEIDASRVNASQIVKLPPSVCAFQKPAYLA
jgi:hypothetical protein